MQERIKLTIMNIKEFRELCLAVPGSKESIQMTHDKIVAFKLMGKVFAATALVPRDGRFVVHLKCDPERIADLRERYAGIIATPFKTHPWNYVYLDSDVPDALIAKLVHHSVDEVVKNLPKKKQEKYKALNYE